MEVWTPEPPNYEWSNSISLSVDNLPLSMINSWLCQIFKNEGRLVDNFESNKLRPNTNYKFGFVRFVSEESARKAMKRNDGLKVRGLKMKVSFSKYQKTPLVVQKTLGSTREVQKTHSTSPQN